MMRSVGVLVVSFLLVAPAWADLPGAQKFLEQAKKQVADKDPSDRVETTLKLVEAELDGVGAAEKEPLVKEIASLRTQMKASDDDAFKKNAVRELEGMFKTAQETLGVRQAGINDQFVEIEKRLNDPKTAAAIGPAEVDKYRKQLATFRKVSDDKMREADVETAKRLVELTEKEFPELHKELTTGSPAAQDGAAQKFQRRLDEFRGNVKDVPKDMPAVVDLTARMEKMRVQVDAAYGQKMVNQVLETLKSNWEIRLDEIQGWEAEQTPVKFEQMVRERSETTSRLGAPKTVAAAMRARQFFNSLSQNEQAKPLLQMSPLKEFVDSIAKLKKDTEEKLHTFAVAILADAEKTTLDRTSRDRVSLFVEDDLRLALEGHPQLADLQNRGRALIKRFDDGAAATTGAQAAALEQAKKDAADRWPGIVDKLSVVEGFDPTNPDKYQGNLIRLKNVRNRAGYDYGAEGDFDFAMDVNGVPFAGKFSPDVKKAIADVNAKTGTTGLPEDTRYDVIAVYAGDKGTLMRRDQIDVTAKVNQVGDVQFQGEKKTAVPVPVLTIVGLYCGPVAVYSPHVTSSGRGFFGRLLDLVTLVLAGLIVLLKAGYAPVASMPQLGAVQTNLTPRNQTIIGYLFIALGVYGLLVGFIYYGLLGNLMLIAAGVFLSLDLFERQTWWKPEWSAKLRQFAVPIGMACGVIGILRLILGGPAFL